eukprot:15463536-Alexandrium_andersonii.AAC.1
MASVLETRRWRRWFPLLLLSPPLGAAVRRKSSSKKYSASFRSRSQTNMCALTFRRTHGV